MSTDRQVLSAFFQNLGERIKEGRIGDGELRIATDAFFEIQVRTKCENTSNKEMIEALFIGFCVQNANSTTFPGAAEPSA